MSSWIVVAAAAALLLALWALRSRSSRGLDMETLRRMRTEGALVVDVRSPREFQRGHVPGSLNIPLDQLEARIGELDRSRPLLLCCASGARSGAAKAFLERSGFHLVQNAGPWTAMLGE